MNVEQERQDMMEKLDIGKELLYLTKDQCQGLGITQERILELTKKALAATGRKEYEMPAKIGVHPYKEVFYHAMPAYVESEMAVGNKWISCYPGNSKTYNLPQTTGLLVMNDVLSGLPTGIMDCTWITAMRTPAVSVLAAEALHPTAETFGMFGCGVQGTEHVRFVVKTLKHLKKIYVYDVSEKAMDNLIEQVQPEIDVEIVKGKSPQQLMETCEVLCSATLILREPMAVVKKEWVSKGQTLLVCDLNTFWDPAISREADQYIVDSMEEHELFADMGYFPEGLPTMVAETGEIIAGLKTGRQHDQELIVCSNIGMAVTDVVVGREVLKAALEQGVGTKLPL